jgi:predicted GNAT family acetyltransferase
MAIMFVARGRRDQAARPRAGLGKTRATLRPVEITVADDAARERYEISVAGEVAGFTQYRRRPELIAFVHTEVDPRFEGQGLAGKLIATALDEARAGGVAVLPFCPFVNAYINRHPEYADLVPEAFRAKFGL